MIDFIQALTIYHITAVAPPPIVNRADRNKSIPIEMYRSMFIASLMNNAPLNKSA
jgi:hypothetical protein